MPTRSITHQIASTAWVRDQLFLARARQMVSDDLLALLVCPLGKAALRREGDKLVCTRCGPRFPIIDDIPNMLIDEAELPPGCSSLADLECVRRGDVKLD